MTASSLPHESAQAYSLARLRRSAAVFLAAKGLTAPLNFICFLLIAAQLPKPEFALYVWLLAFGQLSQQFSFFGLNWIALHQVPYYRSRIGGRAYRLFLIGLLLVRVGLIAVLIAACFVAAPVLVTAVGYQPWLQPLRLYLGVLAAEATVEFTRSCVFEPLLEQGVSQGNVLVQHSVFLAGLLLAVVVHGPAFSIASVLYARGAAVWIALAVALVQLSRVLRQPVTTTAGESPPRWRVLLAFALDNYAQDVMRLTSGGALMTMLASRLVDVSTLAAFGFAQNLAGFVHRLLPAQLFIGLLRPPVIAAYMSDRSFLELRRRIGLILKISSCALASIAALFVAVGGPALALLSGGRYLASYGLLLAFLLWLLVVSLQRMLAVLTNVLGHSELLRRASLASLLVVPSAIVLIAGGAGPYGLVLGMIIGDAVAVWIVAREYLRAGYPLVFDARGYGTIAVATGAAIGLGRLCLEGLPVGLPTMIGAAAATAVCFAAGLRLLRPFGAAERRAIENLLGRRIALL